MSKSTVHAVFSSLENGGSALEALANAGFLPSKISVIGQDSDAFRQATTSLHSKKINMRIIWLGLLGGVVGSLAGFAGMPAVTHVTSPMISSISAVIVGLVLGVYTGVAIGGMMHLDHIPFSEAHFELGRVDQGVMAVSVAPNDERELALVKHLMSEHAACSLSIDLGADLRKSTQLALASSKSA